MRTVNFERSPSPARSEESGSNRGRGGFLDQFGKAMKIRMKV